MKKSLTWIQLSEKEWLLVCVEYNVPMTLQNEYSLRSQGIGIQEEGCIVSAPSYTWRSYRVWKNSELSEKDKSLVENFLKERNPDY